MRRIKSQYLHALLLLIAVTTGLFACKKDNAEKAAAGQLLSVVAISAVVPPSWYPEGEPPRNYIYLRARNYTDSVWFPLPGITGFTPEPGYQYLLRVEKTEKPNPAGTFPIIGYSLIAMVSKEKNIW
jgi:Domain of unknown function (DUF4377)